jgi:hypothetical protein
LTLKKLGCLPRWARSLLPLGAANPAHRFTVIGLRMYRLSFQNIQCLTRAGLADRNARAESERMITPRITTEAADTLNHNDPECAIRKTS